MTGVEIRIKFHSSTFNPFTSFASLRTLRKLFEILRIEYTSNVDYYIVGVFSLRKTLNGDDPLNFIFKGKSHCYNDVSDDEKTVFD